MKKKRLTILFHLILWVIGVGAVVWGDINFYIEQRKDSLSKKEILALIPQANNAKAIDSPIPHYDVFGVKGDLKGVVFITSKVNPKVFGYGGEIPALVGINTKGYITDVKPLQNNETPSYFSKLREEKFFQKFKGKNLTNDDIDEVDVITGATISSEALINDIKLSGRRVALKVLGIDIKNQHTHNQQRTMPNMLDIAIAIASIIAATIASKTKNEKAKWISLAIGFIGIGWYLNDSISFVVIANILKLNPPTLSNLTLTILLIFSMAMALSGRRTWCNYMCPFGAAQEIAYKAIPFRLKISTTLIKHTWQIRYIIIVSILVAVFVFDIKSASEVEPYTKMFNLSSSSIFWYYTGFVLLVSSVIPRFFCRYMCPTGTIITMLMQANSTIRRLVGKKIEQKN